MQLPEHGLRLTANPAWHSTSALPSHVKAVDVRQSGSGCGDSAQNASCWPLEPVATWQIRSPQATELHFMITPPRLPSVPEQVRATPSLQRTSPGMHSSLS